MDGKIVILGAGHVGSHVARALAAGGVGCEIVLVDCVPGKAAAQAMDVADALTWPPLPACSSLLGSRPSPCPLRDRYPCRIRSRTLPVTISSLVPSICSRAGNRDSESGERELPNLTILQSRYQLLLAPFYGGMI